MAVRMTCAFPLRAAHGQATMRLGIEESEAGMKRLLVLVAGACMCCAALSAETGRFAGKVVVEWLDDDPFVPTMRLAEDFAFEDANGKSWVAQKGHVLDGRSLPPAFRALVGQPFAGDYRKSCVLYDYYVHTMAEPWPDVHRMFYRAALAEGVDAVEAKVMYLVLFAQGSRWEVHGSSCFGSCHAAAPALVWRPVVHEEDLRPLAERIRQSNPSLEQIEQWAIGAIHKPGPHIFAQQAAPTAAEHRP
jgi:hypothetical protein